MYDIVFRKREEDKLSSEIDKISPNPKKDETRDGSMEFDELHWSGTPYDTEDSLSQWYIAPKEEVTEFVDFCKALKMNESPYKAVKGWEPAGAKGIHLLNRDFISRIDKNTLSITNDPRRSKKPKPKTRNRKCRTRNCLSYNQRF